MRSHLTDNILIKRMKEGDTLSFEVLFERYAERLHDFALKYVQHPQVAEELMMDVMLWLWEHRAQADDIEKVAPYLSKAIKNKVFDHLRKAVIKTVPLESLPENGSYIKDNSHAGTTVEIAELEEQYHKTLHSLPTQCKKVFELSRIQELTHAEISSHLNISKKTVEGHITNALKMMRRSLPPTT
ncbi:RNA polymerase sigma-70 factor [Sphingobacterium sp. SGG-5]|uniref:RNA polymerase sigma-70 factor n=1 Tax=Sphingobacterium sp. SGG-5 TaxID=2710881 RepID=UPI0013EDD4E9|nr:RNA polymerase sigma-70 factor [Sphingobacterium sp. SGG-5]NGM61583.1 RNA polymerase sigma-70 factor [Sphingobacterium sp. SGG-5]